MNPISKNDFIVGNQLVFLNTFPNFKEYIYNPTNPLQIAVIASHEASNLKETISRISQCLDFYNLYNTNKTLKNLGLRGVFPLSKDHYIKISQLISTMLSAFRNCIDFQNNELKPYYYSRGAEPWSKIVKAKAILYSINIDAKIFRIWLGHYNNLNCYKLSQGIDLSAPLEDGSTWLLHTLHAKSEPPQRIIEALIQEGTPLNARDPFIGCTALGIACYRNFFRTAELLIASNKVDVNIGNYWDVNPLHHAIKNSNYTLMNLLLQSKANCNQKYRHATPLLSYACRWKNIQAIHILLASKADINLKTIDSTEYAALHEAVCNNSIEIVNLLLSANANVDIQTKEGFTSLHKACILGNSEIVNKLIESNANIDHQENCAKTTPLMIACQRGHAHAVQQLIAANANVNLKSIYDKTALHCATEASNKSAEIVNLLLEAKAIVSESITRLTPLHIACDKRSFEIVNLLIEKFNDCPFLSFDDDRRLVNYKTKSGMTPLIISCQNGDIPIVNRLLLAKANIHSMARNGDSPLIVACREGHTQIIQTLLQANAHINIVWDFNVTPLFEAIKCKDLVKGEINANILIEAKANVNHIDYKGKTALIYASEMNYPYQFILKLASLSNKETLRGPAIATGEPQNNGHREKKHCP